MHLYYYLLGAKVKQYAYDFVAFLFTSNQLQSRTKQTENAHSGFLRLDKLIGLDCLVLILTSFSENCPSPIF